MSKVILHTIDGGLAIFNPAPDVTNLDELASLYSFGEYSIVDSSALPEDREFIGAWKITKLKTTTKVEVDLNDAKAIKLGGLIKLAKDKQDEAFKQFQQAGFTNDAEGVATATAKSEAIKALTLVDDIAAIKTLKALKAYNPVELA